MFSCLLRLIPAKCQEVSVLVEGCSCLYICLVMSDLFPPWARELVAMTPPPSPAVTRARWTSPAPMDCENKCQMYGPGYHWQISDVGRYTMLKCYIYKTNHRVGDDAAWQFYALLHVCIIYLLLLLFLLHLPLHLHRPVRLWGPPNLLFFVHCGIFPRVKESHSLVSLFHAILSFSFILIISTYHPLLQQVYFYVCSWPLFIYTFLPLLFSLRIKLLLDIFLRFNPKLFSSLRHILYLSQKKYIY